MDFGQQLSPEELRNNFSFAQLAAGIEGACVNSLVTPTFDLSNGLLQSIAASSTFYSDEGLSSEYNRPSPPEMAREGLIYANGSPPFKTSPHGSPSTSHSTVTITEIADYPSPCETEGIKYGDVLRMNAAAHQSPSTSGMNGKPSPQIGCPEDCTVCGDTATGYHYEVPSCNGCKTFFRRTILAQRKFACKKGKDCFRVLPKEKRCQCRACRFDKCVEVGMNPLAIVTKEDISQNQMFMTVLSKRKPIKEECVEINTPKVLKAIMPVECTVDKLIEGLLYLEIKHDQLRKSSYNPRANSGLNIDKVLERSPLIGKHHEAMPNWPLPPHMKTANWKMSIADHAEKRVPLPAVDYDKLPTNYKMWFYADSIFAIEWARTFEFFHKLDAIDQKTLIKNMTWQCVNITSSYFSYSNNSDTTLFPDGRLPYLWMPRDKMHNIIPILMRLKLDKTEYVILKALVLCNPTWENLTDKAKKVLEPYREEYANALFKYCMAKRGHIDGPSTFSSILAVLDTLMNQAKKAKETHTLLSVFKLRPRPIPLIDEISE